MGTHTIRTHVGAALLGVGAATALHLSAQTTGSADDQLRKLEARVAALERELTSDKPLTVTAPFTVVDKGGKSILFVGGDAGAGVDLTLGSETGARIALNTSSGGAAVAVAAPGQPEVRLVSGADAGVEVLKSGTAGKLDSTPQWFRIAFLGQTDDADEATSVVTVNNGAGEPVAALSADARGGHVQVADLSAAYTAAELSVGEEGGRVRVFDKKSGAPVGGLFGGARGGGLALTGPGGGYSAVSLGVNNGGGAVRVFATTGGAARAALEADAATGGVTAYDRQGNPAAILTSVSGGSGILQLLSGGVTMVEGGTTEDGVGLVRAGPATGGALGNFTVPYQIIGRKAR